MIYFIQEGTHHDGPLKIGYAFDPAIRRDALQAGNPRPLVLLAAINGDRRAEAGLHARFAAGNLGGEWFDPDTPGLAEFIAEATAAGMPRRPPLRRAHTAQLYRTSLSSRQRAAIIAAAATARDRVALTLSLTYGLRAGTLRAIQFGHFDEQPQCLTLRTKSGTSRDLLIPDRAFWAILDSLRLEVDASPHHFLMPTAVGNQHHRREDPNKPMSNRMLHYWWYRQLANAGIVPQGTTAGHEMDVARLAHAA